MSEGGPQEVTGEFESSVRDWVTRLNAWARGSVAEWAAAPEWDAARSRRGGSEIMGYCYDAAMQGRSAMINSFVSAPPPPALRGW